MIENFKKENIGPCKYDFELGEIFKHKKTKEIIDISKDKFPELIELKLPYVLKPGEYVLGRTIEKFNMPLELLSIYASNSIAFRLGMNILCGLNDPGYKGNAIFGIHNISQNKILLFRGMKLLETAFVELKGDATPVQTKFMGGRVL